MTGDECPRCRYTSGHAPDCHPLACDDTRCQRCYPAAMRADAPLRLSTAWRWRFAALVGVVAIVTAARLAAVALAVPGWLAGGACGLLSTAWVAYCNERLCAAWGG